MPRPVLLVVDEDQVVLDDVQAQLVQRYAGDYGVQSVSDPGRALRVLEELANADDGVALVLVGKSLSDANARDVFELARQLHPHAKRAVVVPLGSWADPGAPRRSWMRWPWGRSTTTSPGRRDRRM